MGAIESEIADIRLNCEKKLSDTKIIACTTTLVRIDINANKPNRLMTVCLRYPESYPAEPVLVELKSRVYSDRLLTELTRLIDDFAREHLGKQQSLLVLSFVQQYLRDNPLCVCLDEIKQLRSDLKCPVSGHAKTMQESLLKLKQRNSSVELTARGGNYNFKIIAIVPEEYPQASVELQPQESNLPAVLVRYLNGQSREIARQCVEPPLRIKKEELANFKAQKSLYRTLKFCLEATRDFHAELCPICEKTVLPTQPEDVTLNENDEAFVERVYCGHLFHQGCLKHYLAEPPFPKGGKLCPAKRRHPRSDAQTYLGRSGFAATVASTTKQPDTTVCGIKLAHDRWVLNIKTAEARWAQKQARQRELEEVIDFLQ